MKTRCFSGVKFDILNPKPEDVHPEDIIKSLCTQQRFGGHFPFRYSIADHTLCMLAYAQRCGYGKEAMKYILLHEAAKTYIGDIPKPMKEILRGMLSREVGPCFHVPEIDHIESEIRDTIFERFSVVFDDDLFDEVLNLRKRIIDAELWILDEGYHRSLASSKASFESEFFFTLPIQEADGIYMFRKCIESLSDGFDITEVMEDIVNAV